MADEHKRIQRAVDQLADAAADAAEFLAVVVRDGTDQNGVTLPIAVRMRAVDLALRHLPPVRKHFRDTAPVEYWLD